MSSSANKVSVDLDTTRFNAAVYELQRRTGISMVQIVRHEAGAALKMCVIRTKVASVTKIRATSLKSARLASFVRPLSTTTGHKGGRKNTIWYKLPNAKKPIPVGEFSKTGKSGKVYDKSPRRQRRIGPSIQSIVRGSINDMKADMATNVDRRLRSAGLARQSWLHIADSLNIDLATIKSGRDATAAIAKARAAMSYYINGYGNEFVDGNKRAILTLVNTLPYAVKIRMDTILARAINGRAIYFQQNLRNGVFNDMRQVAAKYPGIIAQQ